MCVLLSWILAWVLAQALSASQIGIIEGVMPAIKVITIPIWGIVADVIRNKKLIQVSSLSNRQNPFVAFLLSCNFSLNVCTRVALQILCAACSTTILMLLAFDSIATNFTRILLISSGISLFASGNLLAAYTFDGTDPYANHVCQ